MIPVHHRHTMLPRLTTTVLIAAGLSFSGCKKQVTGDGAPPPVNIVKIADMNTVTVEKPELFPLVAAGKTDAPSLLNATGAIQPDISREVPVISLASGRVVDIKARLDDHVTKGQLLLKVQSPDITNAFDTYLKARNDEQLANKALARAKDLFEHGAVSQAALEQAEDSEHNAQADLQAAEDQLKTLGVDKSHPSSLMNVYAPISGVIVAQNVTNAAATGVTYSGSSTAFTIADLSRVWILCDVFENDIPKLQSGQTATIHLNAYPDKTLTGRVSDIGPVLDPSIRTAKVRIEVNNPGYLRLGMFANVTFESKNREVHATVPGTAILHLHDREWVYISAGGNQFKRMEVHSGKTLDNNQQEILSGIDPGQPVVTNALSLNSAVEQ